MYSTNKEGMSVVAERFIRTLKIRLTNIWQLCQKNVRIDKLSDIVNEYNNTYHSTIKMKPVDVKDNTYIDFGKKFMIKILNSKLVIIFEYQNRKAFLLKDILQIDLKKFLSIKMLKILSHGHMLLVILLMKKLLEHFMKTYCKK